MTHTQHTNPLTKAIEYRLAQWMQAEDATRNELSTLTTAYHAIKSLPSAYIGRSEMLATLQSHIYSVESTIASIEID